MILILHKNNHFIFNDPPYLLQDAVQCSVQSITTPNFNNQPQNLGDYFYLNPFNCLLTVRESLTTIGVNVVEMIVSGRDNGIPNRSTNINARVTINIYRNENDPFFVNTPYIRTIPETTQIGNTVLTVTARDNDDLVSYSLLAYLFKIEHN